MSTVTFGKHSKITAQPSEQGAIRKFFRDVLGVVQSRKTEGVDIFRLGPQFFLGVIYDEAARRQKLCGIRSGSSWPPPIRSL